MNNHGNTPQILCAKSLTLPQWDQARRAHDAVRERRRSQARLGLVLPVEDSARVERHDRDVILAILLAQPEQLATASEEGRSDTKSSHAVLGQHHERLSTPGDDGLEYSPLPWVLQLEFSRTDKRACPRRCDPTCCSRVLPSAVSREAPRCTHTGGRDLLPGFPPSSGPKPYLRRDLDSHLSCGLVVLRHEVRVCPTERSRSVTWSYSQRFLSDRKDLNETIPSFMQPLHGMKLFAYGDQGAKSVQLRTAWVESSFW